MRRLDEYQETTQKMNPGQLLSWAVQEFGVTRVALASSFSVEDQILTHMLVGVEPRSRIFTLDTGRHFQETYDVWQKSIEYWKISYETCFPDQLEVNRLVAKGPNLFYDSAAQRKSCCAARKTHPLQRVLSSVDAWIAGLRGEQAITRAGLSPVEWDHVNGVYRISPLYNWSESEAFTYAHEHNLPLSVLYKRGFRSIGCAPCTRAIGPEDDVRAGRWWWEEPEHKECGLHNRETA